jgi:hypothetical protein
MARGWESKNVEMQIEEARGRSESPNRNSFPPDKIERRRRREDLILQRTRVIQDLESARSQRYREMLEEMLRHLNAELAAMPEIL